METSVLESLRQELRSNTWIFAVCFGTWVFLAYWYDRSLGEVPHFWFWTVLLLFLAIDRKGILRTQRVVRELIAARSDSSPAK